MDTRRLNFCRGKVITDPQGRYSFITIMPGKYGWGWYTRPAHVHFRVTAPGRQTLVTQMYFSGDSSLGVHDPCGFCGSENPSQVAEPRAPSGDEGSYTVGGTSYTISEVAEWDIVLN
ncbi:protocatechuate 3,4-dioxygenase beta chain-like [Branchiostoma floridae x Branchiostoma japonicum]